MERGGGKDQATSSCIVEEGGYEEDQGMEERWRKRM
jgi:hypothetical protein